MKMSKSLNAQVTLAESLSATILAAVAILFCWSKQVRFKILWRLWQKLGDLEKYRIPDSNKTIQK